MTHPMGPGRPPSVIHTDGCRWSNPPHPSSVRMGIGVSSPPSVDSDVPNRDRSRTDDGWRPVPLYKRPSKLWRFRKDPHEIFASANWEEKKNLYIVSWRGQCMYVDPVWTCLYTYGHYTGVWRRGSVSVCIQTRGAVSVYIQTLCDVVCMHTDTVWRGTVSVFIQTLQQTCLTVCHSHIEPDEMYYISGLLFIQVWIWSL